MAVIKTFIIPRIGTKGAFTFLSPFDKADKIAPNEELTVTAIRYIKELIDAEEKPKDTIYGAMGLTETEYLEDLDNDIPIIVLTKTNGDYYYVPVDRIKNLPDITGHRYRSVILAMKLGSLPLDYDLTKLVANLESEVMDTSGLDIKVNTVNASAITYVSEEQHNKLMMILKNRSKHSKSYKTQVEELIVANNTYKERIKILETELLKHLK